jgi:hypothetical protein
MSKSQLLGFSGFSAVPKTREEEDEFVDAVDQVEVSLPWDVVRLQDGDSLAHAPLPRPA